LKVTEEMISSIVLKVTGSYKVVHRPEGPDSEKTVEIDFTPPFRRVSMISGLEEKLGEKLP